MNRGGSPVKAGSRVYGLPSLLSQCWMTERAGLAD
jgi:hypothetical protein